MVVRRSIRQRTIFVDASAFVAFTDRRDDHHAGVVEAFRLLMRERRPLFTSNLVVAETHALLLRRTGGHVANEWLEAVPGTVVFQSEDDHAAALELLARYADKLFSYADAVSFVLMERLEIPTALTFDEHFRQYGVDVMP